MTSTEYHREWRKTDQGRKSYTITNWKCQGLVGDYDHIYNIYMTTSHCDLCKIQLTDQRICGRSKTTKCMDHDHNTGKFRNILCNSCNVSYRSSNTSGYRYIRYDTSRDKWMFQKGKKPNRIFKRFSNINDAHWYKFVIILCNF